MRMSRTPRMGGISLLLLAGCRSPSPLDKPPVTVDECMLELQHRQHAKAYTLSGTFVCLECGRTEEQTWYDDRLLSSELVADGEDYARRFGVVSGKRHAHEWHLESGFSTEPGNICCTMVMVAGWFRALPKLADRQAVDALYREMRALPSEQRPGLMSSVGGEVWIPHELDHADLDAAFAKWLAKRRK